MQSQNFEAFFSLKTENYEYNKAVLNHEIGSAEENDYLLQNQWLEETSISGTNWAKPTKSELTNQFYVFALLD